MKQKEEYLEKAHAQIDKLGSRIDQLDAELKKKKTDTSATYERELADLKVKRAEAESKLASIKDSGDEAWKSLSEGFDTIMNDTRETFEKVKASLTS